LLCGCTLLVSTSGLAGREEEDGRADTGTTPETGSPTGDARADGADASTPSQDAKLDALPANAVVWSQNGHAYAVFVSPSALSFPDARDKATALGGHLATITSQAEAQFIGDLVVATPNAFYMGYYGPWLGGSQPSPTPPQEPAGGWAWITSEPFAFTAWYGSEPNNDGLNENWLHILGDAYHWNDIREDGDGSVMSYVVEWE
jgi:hypothetical protein